MSEEDVGADGASRAHSGVASHDGGIRVERDAVVDGGVSFLPSQCLPPGEGSSNERNTLVHLDAFAYLTCFTDDGAGSVVDKEVGPDLGSRMEIHAGAAMSPLGHDTGNEGDSSLVEEVGEALDGDRFDKGVSHNHLFPAEGGWISVVGGFCVRSEDFADDGKLFQNRRGRVGCLGPKGAFRQSLRRKMFQTLVNLVLHSSADRGKQIRRFHHQLGSVNLLVVEITGEEEFEKILSNLADGGF